MIKYEELYREIKDILSEKRFNHSKGVVDRALEYAGIYGVDKNIVKLVAISHDIAKELSQDEVDKYIKEYNIKLDEIEKSNKNLIHSIIGAYICRDKYNFSSDMMNAIRYHTTGRANMSMLEKIIYLADATEESRGYEDLDWYVNIIKEDIDRGMIEVSKWVINSLLNNNKQIHNNSIDCYNYYLKKKK